MTGGLAGVCVAVTGAGTALAWALTVHGLVNAALLRRPPTRPQPVTEPVAVLVPARDEEHRIAGCLRSLLAQRDVPDLRILVLDDGSTDGTAALVRAVAAGDPRVRLLPGTPPPPGWLGKPHACRQLADRAGADGAAVLVFVDADVTLAPYAVAAAVALLRTARVDLVSPYPLIVAPGAQRLVQPLLQWSWLTFLPLRLAERSPRPSLTAAGGQFLAVRRDAYTAAGGHAAVRGKILDDIELARAVKQAGGRVALADGSALATCRMYASWGDMVAGYTKSLWASFGSPGAAGAVLGLLALGYLVPPVAALSGGLAVALGWPTGPAAATMALTGVAGYLAGVAGRLVTARATGTRVWSAALAHPVSIVLFGWLVIRSYALRRRITWKGRSVLAEPEVDRG